MSHENKICTEFFGAPYYYDKRSLEKDKHLFLTFVRKNGSVIVSITRDHDKRIETMYRGSQNNFEILFSANVRNSIETRRMFWKELKQYNIGVKREHRYSISDSDLAAIIFKHIDRFWGSWGGELIWKGYIKRGGAYIAHRQE